MGAARIDVPETETGDGPTARDADGRLHRDATILNSRGLHARATAKFVELAKTFDADILVSNGELEVTGLSIMGLLMLGASPGKTISLSATGPQAEEALTALCGLIDDKFHED